MRKNSLNSLAVSFATRFAGVVFCVVLLPGVAVMGIGCAKSSGRVGSDAGIYCENETDCPSGYTCEGNVCVLISDGSVGDGGNVPDIVVDPMMVDFGSPVIGGEVIQAITIHNVGGANLEILDINIFEQGTTEEFTYDPPSQTVLAPGETVDLNVALRPVDSELDIAQLMISSNDPDEPTVTVDLLSSFKGEPLLGFCIVTGDPPPDDCADPLRVDFGTVPYGDSRMREFYLWNDGVDTNKVIHVENLRVNAMDPSHLPLYQLEYFELVPDPNDPNQTIEQAITFPFDLSAESGGVPANELRGRLTFTADTDGFLILQWDSLEAETTNTDDPNPVMSAAPIYAVIDGCPPDKHDLNGDPADGCEYECTITNGGTEICDSLDNDCNGTTDDLSGGCYTGGDGGCNPDGTNCQGLCQGGTWGCQGGNPVCQGQVVGTAEQCDNQDHDCNGDPINGLDPEGGNSCGAEINVGTIPEGASSVTVNGMITLGAQPDEDWYRVTFQDVPETTTACDPFRAEIEFVDPPGGGDFRFDVYINAACNQSPVCASGSNTGLTQFHWDSIGDCDCTLHPECVDNTMQLRVRVYKVGGPVCDSYQLQFRN